MDLYGQMAQSLEERGRYGLRRIEAKAQQHGQIIADGRAYLNLSSNDYLGLAQEEGLFERFMDTLPDDAKHLSSSGSPLLTGAFPSYERCRELIEATFHKSCLFFNSGYDANCGVIAALSNPGTVIIADKLSHASIIDGMQAGKGKAIRYAHNDLSHLGHLIEEHSDAENILVVTEAVFSMDGDIAPLEELVALKKRHQNVYLYVDEAHSFTLWGKAGLGLCDALDIKEDVDFILCTCGKGLASQGAFLLSNETARDYLINAARPLIFSTAIPPIAFEHIRFMFELIKNLAVKRMWLFELAGRVNKTLEELGLETLSKTQIVPVLTYDNEKAVKAAAVFRGLGLYAMPIRHPTVPKGKARLRLSLNAGLNEAQVNEICDGIRRLASEGLCSKDS